MLLDLRALGFVALVFGLFLLLLRKRDRRLLRASRLTFLFVFPVSLFGLCHALGDLSDPSRLGPWLSFALLSNAYAGAAAFLACVRDLSRKP